jgi:pyruvate dehydrogenase E1 component
MSKTQDNSPWESLWPNPDHALLSRIIERIHVHAMTMIYLANNRSDVQKGDPKVGGHPSACSSALHLLSLLHLVARRAQDFIAVKPHASPTDHSNHYFLKMFRERDGSKMSDERARMAMKHLRHFPKTPDEVVFQSYHSEFDPDHFHMLPSGSVGIPPVNALYLAEAYRLAAKHGMNVPANTHFWCVMGDSEYREGSLMEALPEASERGLENVTWIVDYNRQSLDGHRILNEYALGGKDCDRIEKTAIANGWDTLQLRHGSFRKSIFTDHQHGEALQNVIENAMSDYELQSLLAKKNAKDLVEAIARYDLAASKVLGEMTESDALRFLGDLGGHDTGLILDAFEAARNNKDKPMLIVAHTIKGWHLKCEAMSGNHSAMLEEDEVRELRKKAGLFGDDLTSFERFDEKSPEGKYLKDRSDFLWKGIQSCEKLKQDNLTQFKKEVDTAGLLKNFPKSLDINLKFVPFIHTQWMLGQMSAKLNRIADTYVEGVKQAAKPLTDAEKLWKPIANHVVTLAPDVGSSTNLNASMDGKVFAPDMTDYESEYGVKDSTAPDIVPKEAEVSRHLRFEIAEGNAMSCLGSLGKMAYFTGLPLVPVMTIYDFFIKRALDQLFYNCYWKSHFILVGTPAGVTLSPEGAQHAWKSDVQIANMITWEPTYALEFEWIFVDAIRRHVDCFTNGENASNTLNRAGVLIRGSTRALEQKEMLNRLKKHKRFEGKSDAEILESTRQDCLEGAWYVVDHRGYPHYRPGENVINIFAMGSPLTEALKASDKLLEKGIFANVIHVSSPDLICGNLGEDTNFHHLRQGLGIHGDLYLKTESKNSTQEAYPPKLYGPAISKRAQIMTLGGRRIPIVSVHDGERGLLDNIGSIVGTLQKVLAVKKHSKSGRPVDIYNYHGLDSDSVAKACEEALNESAFTAAEIMDDYSVQKLSEMGIELQNH